MQIQEQYMEQARKLHQACPVAEAHLGLAGELLLHVNKGEREALRRHYLDELREGGFNLVVSSVYLENEYLPEMGLRKAMDQIGVLLEELDQNEEFLLVKNVRDLDRALEEDRIGVLLYLEGMDFVGTDFHLLRTLWEAGVRGASLTWSRRNALASGCCVASKRIPVPGGLTVEGVEAVRRDLIAYRFARAGRHDAQHIPAGQDCFYQRFLPRPETVIAKIFLQYVMWIHPSV